MTQANRNILAVGGKFDKAGGRPSGYFKKLIAALSAALGVDIPTVNGGYYDTLCHTALSMPAVTHLIWFADVPNDLPKFVRGLVAMCQPGAVLVQSKNNRSEKYSFDELVERMLSSGAELLVEFSDTGNNAIAASVLTTHGIAVLHKSTSIDAVAECIKTEFDRIDSLQFPMRCGEVPTDPFSLGGFAARRKNHIHEGVDIYAPEGEPVFAMESGLVYGVYQFTGEAVGSPWWNDTCCVMICGRSGIINYGEIVVDPSIFIGIRVDAGRQLGTVKQVLKNDKGRPMSMLHLERYTCQTDAPIKEWPVDTPQPANLRNPTSLLVRAKKT